MANPARSGATKQLTAFLCDVSAEQPMTNLRKLMACGERSNQQIPKQNSWRQDHEEKNVRLSRDQRDSSHLAVLDFECGRAVSYFDPGCCDRPDGCGHPGRDTYSHESFH